MYETLVASPRSCAVNIIRKTFPLFSFSFPLNVGFYHSLLFRCARFVCVFEFCSGVGFTQALLDNSGWTTGSEVSGNEEEGSDDDDDDEDDEGDDAGDSSSPPLTAGLGLDSSLAAAGMPTPEMAGATIARHMAALEGDEKDDDELERIGRKREGQRAGSTNKRRKGDSEVNVGCSVGILVIVWKYSHRPRSCE